LMFLCQQQVPKTPEPGSIIDEEVSTASKKPLEVFLENVLAAGYLVPMYQSAESDSAATYDVPLTYQDFCENHHDTKVVTCFEELKRKYPHHNQKFYSKLLRQDTGWTKIKKAKKSKAGEKADASDNSASQQAAVAQQVLGLSTSGEKADALGNSASQQAAVAQQVLGLSRAGEMEDLSGKSTSKQAAITQQVSGLLPSSISFFVTDSKALPPPLLSKDSNGLALLPKILSDPMSEWLHQRNLGELGEKIMEFARSLIHSHLQDDISVSENAIITNMSKYGNNNLSKSVTSHNSEEKSVSKRNKRKDVEDDDSVSKNTRSKNKILHSNRLSDVQEHLGDVQEVSFDCSE